MRTILILGLIIMSNCSSCEFDYDYQENWQTTITRWVGPTTQTGVRGTLPQPTPNDTNSIWLAKNGNDANPGTQASPKLTLAGAIAALTATATTVHIFRNGYVGILTFTPGNETLPASRNIQVEEGEVAYFEFSGTDHLTMGASSKINGIYLQTSSFISASSLIDASTADDIEISNCHIRADNFDFQIDPLDIPIGIYARTSTKISHCIVISSYHGVDFPDVTSTGSGYIKNTIFYGRKSLITNTIEDDIFLTGNTGIASNIDATSQTFTIDRNIFIDCVRAITDANETAGAHTNTWDITNCDFFNVDVAFSVRSNRTPAHTVNINFDYCHIATLYNVKAAVSISAPQPDTIDSGVVITNSNQIPNKPPLYVNGLGILNLVSGFYQYENSRLQFKGKLNDFGTRYHITSPLVDAGLAGVDVSPWDETTTLISTAFNKSFILDKSAYALQITPQFQNPVELNDVNGNLHNDYDGVRLRFDFTYGDGYAITNEEQWKLINMISDRGSKRFYLRGKNNSIFDDTATGIFDTSDDTLSPLTATPMVPDHWRGFWIIFNSNHYYIDSNDEDKFYLVDKLGNGFPVNANYNFSIEYILVKTPLETIIQTQKNFTIFNLGGSWRESFSGIKAYNYTIDKFALVEVEDHEENL